MFLLTPEQLLRKQEAWVSHDRGGQEEIQIRPAEVPCLEDKADCCREGRLNHDVCKRCRGSRTREEVGKDSLIDAFIHASTNAMKHVEYNDTAAPFTWTSP